MINETETNAVVITTASAELEIIPNVWGYWVTQGISGDGSGGAFIYWDDMSGASQERLLKIKAKIEALVEEARGLLPNGFNSDFAVRHWDNQDA